MNATEGNVYWRNARVVAPFAVLQLSCYFLLNHFPLFPPAHLPLSVVDGWVPFWPWTVWPYLLMLAIGPVLPLMVRSDLVFRRLLLAYLLTLPAIFVFFIFWPTEYVRPPAPADDSLHSLAYRVMIAVDTEGCCFPSGHIVVPVLFAWGLWLDGRRLGPFWCGLVALLAPTILTTKQHYFWDLLGALAIVAASLAVAHVVIRPRGRVVSAEKSRLAHTAQAASVGGDGQ